ncbi:Rieske (2Fe-2S) protein [Microbispora sp. RL4-1S]|uniref:Cytochrome bc1 complex Rieske iron-sulfur subunit n=1 Tax=Microbispora oryzae TaxID=2806554 RepID=A0A941AIT3_9ACTN|nr:Rieske (2Fe-2S) protein [Microbispora oryzae]MBP2703468.1 Rieske (2Fe-2S) protein [Microbispora oryzae]
MTDTTRRAVIFSAGGAGLAVALSACAGGGSGDTDTAAPAGGGSGGDGGGDGAVAQTSQIPVGGGKILEDRKLVIVQPAKGDFKAFSAICTHRGCTVASVSNGTINCPCHGSKFNVKDGSVVDGPATQPLAEQKIKVSGDSITLA